MTAPALRTIRDAAGHGISILAASIFETAVFLPFREWIITMLDERFRTHRNNIARYRGLLKTNLTDLERQFIERRLSEEQSEFELLSAGNLPHKFRHAPQLALFLNRYHARIGH